MLFNSSIIKSFLPFKWSYQDVEKLKYKDNQFDFCIIHHGLHHCASPHRGLLELYRVAKNGIIVFDGIDNLMTKIGILFGFSEQFELAAVFNSEFKYGGFINTNIPNYVYRWTKNEIKKTIASYEPRSKPKLDFFYGLDLPFKRLRAKKNKLFYLIAVSTFPLLAVMFLLFHKSIGNRFAFFINKTDLTKERYPWLEVDNNIIKPNKPYFKKKIK